MPIFRTSALSIALCLLGNQIACAMDPVNPLHLRPHHVTASVGDLDRAVAWYQQILGFAIRQRGIHGDVAFAELAIPGFGIALIKQPEVGRLPAQPRNKEPRWLHVVFSVPRPDVTYHALEIKGVALTARRSPNGHIQSFLITDSEGNELEIVGESSP